MASHCCDEPDPEQAVTLVSCQEPAPFLVTSKGSTPSPLLIPPATSQGKAGIRKKL